MKFSLLISAAPCNAQAPITALRFAQAALQAGHNIHRIFFFRDGVHNASTFAVYQQDEVNIPQQWQQFCTEYNLDAVICVSAALKRGILDPQESRRHQRNGSNADSNIQTGGLGMLTEAIIHSDRLISFG